MRLISTLSILLVYFTLLAHATPRPGAKLAPRRPRPTPSSCTVFITPTETITATSTEEASTATDTVPITESPSTITAWTTSTITSTETTTVTATTACDFPLFKYSTGTCTRWTTAPTIYFIAGSGYVTYYEGVVSQYGTNSLIFTATCDRLQNLCNAPQETLEKCWEARDAALQASGQEAADRWNDIIAQC